MPGACQGEPLSGPGKRAGGPRVIGEKEKKALQELQGTSRLIGMEGRGAKLTEKDFQKLARERGLEGRAELVIKGDQIIAFFLGGDEDPATIVLNPTREPAQIDILSEKGGKTEVNHGIYKLEGGVLTTSRSSRRSNDAT